MISLRVLGLTAFVTLASSQNVATRLEHSSGAAAATKRQTDFFEVTSCHAHGDTTFCIYEGDEWEVTSGVDSGSTQESFEGCHSHSGTEIHCVDAAQTYDVSLTLESEDESAHTEEEDHDHAAETTTGTTAETDHEITEVTECHAHTDTLFCMAGNEEWEVTTDLDVENPPDGYTGCHAHGEDELHCTDGDVEVSLSRAAATTEGVSGSTSSEAVDCHSHAGVEHCVDANGETVESDGEQSESTSSSSSSATAGEAVDCHSHAGVEHCVDAQGRTVDMGCAAPNHDYDVPLRIGLLFVILVTSAIGVFAPILTSRFTSVSMNGTLIVAMRQFGTGVIISTAIVHLFTHAELFFSNDCIEGIEYEATAGAIMIAGLFITFIIEYIAHRWVDRRRHMFERSPATGANPEEANRQKEASEGTLSESSSSETHYTPKSLTLNTTVMEAGIIFHSILIGLTLVVAADSGFITLFIVIVFHQIFEGFALGARIAMIPSSFIRKAILGGAFAVTTPVGMAIGIGVLSSFNGNDPSTLIAIGTLNAFSAGILLWVGVAEMWFVEWFHGPLAHAGPLKTGICFLSLVAGLVLMSFLGKWA